MITNCTKCGAAATDWLTTRLAFKFKVFFTINIDQQIALPIPKWHLLVKDMNLNFLPQIIKVFYPDLTVPDVTSKNNSINVYHCWNCGNTVLEAIDRSGNSTVIPVVNG